MSDPAEMLMFCRKNRQESQQRSESNITSLIDTLLLWLPLLARLGTRMPHHTLVHRLRLRV